MKARKARDKADGLWSGGRAPYGLTVAGDRTLIIDPNGRPVVELIFDLYVCRRMGVDRIRQELRRMGVTSPNGRKTWSRNAVLNVLRQRAYVYGVHEATGVKSETFIPVETFERTQQLLRDNARLRHARSGESWPLSPMRCAACASTFGAENGGTRRRTYFDRGRYSGSSHYLRTGSGCRAVRRLPADFIEPLVLRRLIEVFRDPRAFRLAVEREIRALKSAMSGDEGEVAVLQSEREFLRRSLKRLAINWVDGVLSDEEIDHKRRAVTERLDAVEARIIEIGPERLEDLERTYRLVAGLERWKQITEEREQRGLPMNAFSLIPSLAETDQLVEARASNRVPVRMPEPDDVPHVLRTWLNRLHADLSAHPDRIEIRGLIDFDALFDDPDDSGSGRDPTPNEPHESIRQDSLLGRRSGGGSRGARCLNITALPCVLATYPLRPRPVWLALF